MKYLLVGIIGALVGSYCTYLYMGHEIGHTLGGAFQMSYEVSLSNDLRAIEILETHDGEALRRSLITGLACAKSVYENSLNSEFWARTDYSEHLLQSLEKYSSEAGCPASEDNA